MCFGHLGFLCQGLSRCHLELPRKKRELCEKDVTLCACSLLQNGNFPESVLNILTPWPCSLAFSFSFFFSFRISFFLISSLPMSCTHILCSCAWHVKHITDDLFQAPTMEMRFVVAVLFEFVPRVPYFLFLKPRRSKATQGFKECQETWVRMKNTW